MASSTQKALILTQVGSPLSLVTDWPILQPGAGQVLIRVTGAGVNPLDQKSRDYGVLVQDHLPAVLVNDVAGEVTVLGSGVTKYTVGDHIFGQGNFTSDNSQNGLQEFAILDVDFSTKVPEGFTDSEAATLPIATIAPLVAIFDASNLAIPAPWTAEAASFDYKNLTLLILGGGAYTGRAGVQWAAIAGIGRIVVVGGDEEELRLLGATHVVSRHGSPDEIVDRVRTVVGDELAYVYDAVNPPSAQHIGVNSLSRTKKGGKFVRLVPTGPIDEAQVKLEKGDYQVFDSYGSSHFKAELTRPFWDKWFSEYLVQKKIVPVKPVVIEGLDADKANQVLDQYKQTGKVVKTVFRVNQ